MDIDPPTPQNDLTTTKATPSQSQPQPQPPTSHTRTLTTLTLKSPPSAYAHLSLSLTTTTTPTATTTPRTALDMLQLRAYLTTALRQFLGDTGAAIPVDFLAVRGADAWVRVPRQDLAAFVGAVTAFSGVEMSAGSEEGRMVLRVVASGDWLGSLVGKGGEGRVWSCSG